jgi:hypothetical protein
MKSVYVILLWKQNIFKQQMKKIWVHRKVKKEDSKFYTISKHSKIQLIIIMHQKSQTKLSNEKT